MAVAWRKKSRQAISDQNDNTSTKNLKGNGTVA